jgi:two-component system sensor histidine kinase PrrB
LQSALINLDIARSDRIAEPDRTEVLGLAHEQLQRMATSLSAVRALADAEFADPSWFDQSDLADLADAAVADERRRAPDAVIDIESTPSESAPSTTTIAWRDGARLAIANIVRNALIHGVPPDGGIQRIVVTVHGTTVTVDDNGPGVAPADRERVLQRFERGGGHGSGLGLAIAQQVAVAHGGTVRIESSPLGGARVVLSLAPEA